jgi:hypothetical protein
VVLAKLNFLAASPSKKQRPWALFFFNITKNQNSNFHKFVRYLGDE